MLETIRKSTRSKYILLLFGAIILVFVFWGIGPGGRGKSANAVATVDGEPIEMSKYLALHKRLTDYYRNVLKDKYTPAVEKGLKLKHNAVSILIDRRLSVMAAESKGINVSKQEVQESIASIASFQKDGVFDKDRYFSALRSERLQPADFEEDVRRDLLVERMRADVIKDVAVTDDDVKKAYLKENKEIDLSYVSVNAADKFGDIKVTDEDGKKYLIDHSTDFVRPARVKAVYAYAGYKAYKKLTSPGETELREYYNKNKDRYSDPEKIHARHILIRPDSKEKDGEAAKKAAVEKAESLLKRIKGGEDFALLAKKNSADPGSAKKGGDLGWFPRGVMMKSFEDAAFALKPGEISGVIETPFGAHIIKLEGRKKAVARPFAKVRVSIKAILSQEKARASAEAAIKAIEGPFKGTEDVGKLKRAVKKKTGIVFHETGLFDSKHYDKALAKVRQFKDSLFLMSKGEVSEPVKTHDGFYLVKIVKREDARIPEYDEVKDEVKGKLRAKKALRLAKKEAKEILKTLKGGKKLGDVAKEKGLKVSSTGLFTVSNGFVPSMGVPVQPYMELFDLDEKKPLYKKTIVSSGKFFVVELTRSKEADISGLTSDEKDSLREMLQSKKEEKKIDEWLTSLRKKSEIQVFEDRM